jgi:hypothetical protein
MLKILQRTVATGLCCLAAGCMAFRPIDTTPTPSHFTYEPSYPIQSLELEDFASYAASQEDPVWCWAACAAMVRDYTTHRGQPGHEADPRAAAKQQADVVARILQRTKESGGSEEAASKTEVLGALDVEEYEKLLEIEKRVEGNVTEAVIEALLSGDEEADDDTGAGDAPPADDAAETPEPEPPHVGFDAARLYAALSQQEPVVAALRSGDGTGHVVVVIGAQYQKVPEERAPGAADGGTTAVPGVEYRFMAIQLWDPSKDLPDALEKFGGEHWLAGSEFAAHCDFMASAETARAYVKFLEDHALWAEEAFAPKPETPH